MRHFITYFTLFCISLLSYSQNTYKKGKTEYYTNQYYKTGYLKVKRSQANKNEFLESLGYDKTPKGYEIDHRIALSQGGTDSPSNMQLLTKEEHKQKTKSERKSSISNKIIYTGSKGGKYYYNAKGKKIYLTNNQ